MKKNKYGNHKTEAFGQVFHSKLELNRYIFLMNEEKINNIKELVTQVRYELNVNGHKICSYIADFVYKKNGIQVVEDTKGVITASFRIKAKLMNAIHGIKIRIVRKPTEPI